MLLSTKMFIHIRSRQPHRTRGVFQQNAPAQKVLNYFHTLGNVIGCFFGIRQRQQIMRIFAMYPCPANMIRNPFRLNAVYQFT